MDKKNTEKCKACMKHEIDMRLGTSQITANLNLKQSTGFTRVSKETMMFLLALWGNEYPLSKKPKHLCSSVVFLSKNRGHAIYTEYDRYPVRISAARFACLKYGTKRLSGSTVFCSKMPKNEVFKSLVNAHVGTITVLCDQDGKYEYEEEGLEKDSKRRAAFEERRNAFFSVSHATIRKFYIDEEIVGRIKVLVEDLRINDKSISDSDRLKRWFLGMAFLNCLRSEDDHLGVGSVLVSNGKDLKNSDVLSVGFNGIQPNVTLQNLPIRESSHDLIKERVVHAEENALLFRNYVESESLKNCALFTTLIACDDCARFINLLGIEMYYSCYKTKFTTGEVDPKEKGEQIVIENPSRIQKFVVRNPVQFDKLKWDPVKL